MIKVNSQDLKWFEGMTVKDILKIKGYTFPTVIVKINGVVIKKEDYNRTTVNDGDNVQALHIFAGG